jgi:hypothetical protein
MRWNSEKCVGFYVFVLLGCLLKEKICCKIKQTVIHESTDSLKCSFSCKEFTIETQNIQQ